MSHPRWKIFPVADLAIATLLILVILGGFAITNLWSHHFQPVTFMNLSPLYLPYYTLLSATRAGLAYLLSLAFTLVVGYAAAHHRRAEKILIPLLDVLQSVPIFGFLPGILLSLVALFPHSNLGLELSAVVCIFTSQVWNLTFCFYEQLKSIPKDLIETSRIMNLTGLQRLIHLELPSSATALAWNSVLSMAGGWFFLMTCEAFTLGDREFRIPGLGSYLDLAVKAGDYYHAALALMSMAILIFCIDFLVWRPILVWSQKFLRHFDPSAPQQLDPVMLSWLRDSVLIEVLAHAYHKYLFRPLSRLFLWVAKAADQNNNRSLHLSPQLQRLFWIGILIITAIFLTQLTNHFLTTVLEISIAQWISFFWHGLISFMRILIALALALVLFIPLSIAIGTKPHRLTVLQPLIQLLASFPGSMLYPLILVGFQSLKIPFDWTCILLIFIGMQWYVFFNLIGGASRISPELLSTLKLANAKKWTYWKDLYLPSILPSLVTGAVTASGAGWNAIVIAEFLEFRNQTFISTGLGSDIRLALTQNHQAKFLASLTVMVALIILINRFLWTPLYHTVLKNYQND